MVVAARTDIHKCQTELAYEDEERCPYDFETFTAPLPVYGTGPCAILGPPEDEPMPRLLLSHLVALGRRVPHYTRNPSIHGRRLPRAGRSRQARC